MAALGNRLESIENHMKGSAIFEFKPCGDGYFCQLLCQLISLLSAFSKVVISQFVRMDKQFFLQFS